MKTWSQFSIWGIKFDDLRLEETAELLFEHLNSNHGFWHVATPNPEILLLSQEHHDFAQILQKTDLNTIDGAGIFWAKDFLAKKRKYPRLSWLSSLLSFGLGSTASRRPPTTGSDLMAEICHNPRFNKFKIFLLGGRPDSLVLELQNSILKQNPKCQIVGISAASPNDTNLVKQINDSEADILFVAYGAPKQEIWINQNRANFKHLKIAIGVGGAFNFLAGAIKRAPQWLRQLRLEWLYRLIQEPSTRARRIFNATIKFPYLVGKNYHKKNS